MGKALLPIARRPSDLSARYGGEEFVAVWYDSSPEALAELAENTLKSIRKLPLQDPATGQTVTVTASAGLVWLKPEATDTAEAILHQSDELLYRAKKDGGNRAILQPYPRA